MIIIDPIAITDDVLISTNVPAENPQFNVNTVYGPGDQVNNDATNAHSVYQQLRGVRAPVTLTLGSPGVVNWPGHGKANGQPVKLSSTGSLLGGLIAGATYYVVGATAGAVQLAATPGGTAISFTGTQSGTHTITANDIGKALDDPDYWVKVGATNARKMFDEYNNTVTSNPEVITVVLNPKTICGGIYMGGVSDADEVVVTMEYHGNVVYSKTTPLLQSTSKSSFFNWIFNRIRRANYFLALDLPRYYAPKITVSIRKPGGVPKCGMFAVGPLTDVGMSLAGMALEDKDYSSIRFDPDGASETTVRGYSKILSLEVKVDNDQISAVTDILRSFRQRNVVYIGSHKFGHSVVVGKYESLKSIMPNVLYSIMAFKINGVV